MQLESHQIPQSLQGYIEQFDTDPEAALGRLENHVEKRNPGAVGYFFLAWLHHRQGNQKRAIQCAMSAKVMAPGSRLMERLHYLLTHPRTFAAWEPEATPGRKSVQQPFSNDRGHPIQDLDTLITKLSSVESHRIKPKLDGPEGQEPDLSEASSSVDDIVTETLAGIHEKQNNYSAAIETYKKLRKANPGRKTHYDEQIFRLKQIEAEQKK
ncbi:MAG: tetratricopeptide repeat protein [Balneolaceae bacterium]|nr:tetratricopeptide repeat protein [Balneolaceae bacterium]MCH8549622.1 hypothetical protein [Balneolaceae bacterium]